MKNDRKIGEKMLKQENDDSKNPSDHVQNLARRLHELKDHCRDDVRKVNDPKAQALFETTAEVLGGLEKAMNDFREKNEPAWK